MWNSFTPWYFYWYHLPFYPMRCVCCFTNYMHYDIFLSYPFYPSPVHPFLLISFFTLSPIFFPASSLLTNLPTVKVSCLIPAHWYLSGPKPQCCQGQGHTPQCPVPGEGHLTYIAISLICMKLLYKSRCPENASAYIRLSQLARLLACMFSVYLLWNKLTHCHFKCDTNYFCFASDL